MKILILCTGNSCRSQMAEGFLKSFNPQIEVNSAGTHPADQINPNTVIVMAEEKIDMTTHFPKNVDQFTEQNFDYVITVCDNARETCPIFTGKVIKNIHLGFDDPAQAAGTDEEIMAEYRRIRNEIKEALMNLYQKELQPQLHKL